MTRMPTCDLNGQDDDRVCTCGGNRTHTPTPWVDGCAGNTDLIVTAHSGIPIGRISSKQDRQFVLTACNAHDDLVAALIPFSQFKCDEFCAELADEKIKCAHEIARAALAKAEAK